MTYADAQPLVTVHGKATVYDSFEWILCVSLKDAGIHWSVAPHGSAMFHLAKSVTRHHDLGTLPTSTIVVLNDILFDDDDALETTLDIRN